MNLIHFQRIFFCLTMLASSYASTAQTRGDSMDNRNDFEVLHDLNRQFIENYVSMDTVAHNEIIHRDFVCIESSGQVVNRNDYMKDWATSYKKGGFTSFEYADEHIRIFDKMALVRSKTIYSLLKDGKTVSGTSIYTDTYIKENGRWWCVQAQITGIKK